MFLFNNRLPSAAGSSSHDARRGLLEICGATTTLSMIRDEAATIAIGLQELELPALVTLEIIDAAFDNSIAMHLKWKLVTSVKHWHEQNKR